MLSNLIQVDIREALIEEQRIINILVALIKKYIQEMKKSKKNHIINSKDEKWAENIKEILNKNKSLSVALAFSIAKYSKKLSSLNDKVKKKLRVLKLEIYLIKNILLSVEKLNLQKKENIHAKENIESILKDLIVEADFYQELNYRLEHFIEELKGENIQESILELLEIIDKQREFLKLENKEVILKLSEQEIIPNAKLIFGISKIVEYRKKSFRNLREISKRLIIRDKRLIKLKELEKLSERKELISEVFFNSIEKLLKSFEGKELEDFSIEELEKKADFLTKDIDKELSKIAPL
ncbi:MAG: hypothetical protein QXU20_02060 [Candidatus Woesearchaeota archaeon]